MYILLTINFIGNILLTTVLCISSRNIKILKAYQQLYLVLSIILWIVICFFYLAKLGALIYVKITKKHFNIFHLNKKLKYVWIITNGSSYLIMLIGLIYDIVLLLKGEIASAIYPIIYFIICFIYLICSIIDFFFIESIVKLICEPPRIIYLEDKADEKKNEEVDNEDNKTKLE